MFRVPSYFFALYKKKRLKRTQKHFKKAKHKIQSQSGIINSSHDNYLECATIDDSDRDGHQIT